MTSFRIRPERPGDQPAIHRAVSLAFGGEGEARIVDALRANGKLALSLVAEEDGVVVGHVGLSTVEIRDGEEAIEGGVGLAPLSVVPKTQRRGIGSALVREALEMLAKRFRFVVVVGDPVYYSRFGFTRASDRGLRWDHPGHDESFMVKALREDGLRGVRGVVSYRPELVAGSDSHPRPSDWGLLARVIGSPENQGGDYIARLALARILGDEEIIRAVHTYVSWGPGFEVARSVLWFLRPRTASLECERIFRDSHDLQERRNALELVRGIRDASVLDWLENALRDPDQGVRNWAIDVLRYLGYGGMIELTHVERHLAVAREVAEAMEPGPERDDLVENVEGIRSMFADVGAGADGAQP